jgi:MerR family transcriptional regulator/heat shock protein HspR
MELLEGKDTRRMQEREGLYIISVAARLLEMHQQTLRKYERAGFVRPKRTGGNLRLYSIEDVERLRQIKYLVDQLGMNLTGVEAMLHLTRRLRLLHQALAPGLSDEETDVLRTEVAQMLDLLGAADVAPAGREAAERDARSLAGRS